VDNPETHLELTMIHEAMLLEYSGPDLAMMEMSHAVKQTLLMAVLINVLFPVGIDRDAYPTFCLDINNRVYCQRRVFGHRSRHF